MQSSTKDNTAAFVQTLKNNLSRKQRRKSSFKYPPVETDNQYTNLAWYESIESVLAFKNKLCTAFRVTCCVQLAEIHISN